MQFKLISFGFDVDKLAELPSRDDFMRALDEVARIARLRGRPIATSLIPHRIEHGRVEEVLGEVAPDPNSLGIVFKRVEGGSFKYQGEVAELESFELAETPFTIGQMKGLLESKRDEVRGIFQDREWNIDKVIKESEKKIAGDVPAEERDNCPLVYVNQVEAKALARLLGYKLPNEKQWERAASGTDGLKRPWGDDFSEDKAVYSDTGTRPAKSKPGGVNAAEGIHDLIGLVWEWTQERVLRGGSWYGSNPGGLQADFRGDNYQPERRSRDVGLRFARTIK